MLYIDRQFLSPSRNPFSYQYNGSGPDVSLMNGDKIKRPEEKEREKRERGSIEVGIPRGRVRNREASR